MQESVPIRLIWFATAAALIAAFSVMGFCAVRMALADYQFRKQNLPGTLRALRLEPDSANYHSRLAVLIQESNPAGSTEALRRAVALNPWDSPSWVELGLRAEASGDLAGAERNLLRAASVDKQYFPRWSLVNYYFRRNDSEKFWLWVHAATQMGYGNLTPLFTLCWKVSSDGAFIEQKLGISKPDLEANYLSFLITQNRIGPMTRAATQLLAWDREVDTPLLLAACDRLIADDRAAEAVGIWNRLAQLHRIPYPPLAPAEGRYLTNGDLTLFPTLHGFDWRLPDVGGVTPSLEGPAGLRISFSGRQPEYCDVLSQVLPVMEKRNYELRFLYRTSGIAPETGLRFRITDLNGAKTLAQGESLASESDRESSLPFSTPPSGGLVRLTLNYQRALGTTRIEGYILLRQVRLIEAQAPSQ